MTLTPEQCAPPPVGCPDLLSLLGVWYDGNPVPTAVFSSDKNEVNMALDVSITWCKCCKSVSLQKLCRVSPQQSDTDSGGRVETSKPLQNLHQLTVHLRPLADESSRAERAGGALRKSTLSLTCNTVRMVGVHRAPSLVGESGLTQKTSPTPTANTLLVSRMHRLSQRNREHRSHVPAKPDLYIPCDEVRRSRKSGQ